MCKRVISLFLAVAMIFCFVPLSVFADEHQHTFENKHGFDLSDLPDGYSIPFTIYEAPCSGNCGYSEYSWNVFGVSGQFVDKTGTSGLNVYKHYTEWFESVYGKNATATKFTPGGGSTSGGGVGRPKGYADDNGIPNYNHEGKLLLSVPCNGIFAGNFTDYYTTGPSRGWDIRSGVWHPDVLELDVNHDNNKSGNGVAGEVNFYIKAPVTGIYYVYKSDFISSGSVLYVVSGNTTEYKKENLRLDRIENRTKNTNQNIVNVSNGCLSLFCNAGDEFWVMSGNAYYSSFAHFSGKSCKVVVDPTTNYIENSTSITINNNTWNGNIYVDNSNNLTYIYPQYTTVNEKNETVTNISNNPIIYNNETKQYYTYDQTTKNYYYITYNAQPTPSPSPTPAPTEKPGGSISTPETGKPGGDTGDTTGILAVLVEIRDNMIQGFLDIKAAFVAGFAELSANFTLAIENLNVNIQNIFNKKFPDQSTPETALPSPTPSPSPAPTDPPSPSPAPTDPPSPSPAPDPGKPDSGDKTNNFWTIIFPHGGGTEDGKKGIFWALVSLILALIAFFANLAVGVGYLFPFLPDGVVMTINTCLIVIFLFTIIKFIMRSK